MKKTIIAGLPALMLAGFVSAQCCGCAHCGVKPRSGAVCPACTPETVCTTYAVPTAAKAALETHNINTFQMKEHVDAGKAIILDARSGKYDDGYRIPGAQSLNSKSSAEEVAKVVPKKDSLVVTYCSNLQCPASKRLAERLHKLGYTNVLEYPEGIAGWKAAGGKVSKVK